MADRPSLSNDQGWAFSQLSSDLAQTFHQADGGSEITGRRNGHATQDWRTCPNAVCAQAQMRTRAILLPPGLRHD